MNFRDLPKIQNKFGVNVVITTDNIKDIYFATNCNTQSYDAEISRFMEENYLQSDVLWWNYEYYNAKIEECCYAITAENDSLTNVFNILLEIQKLCAVYTDRYEVYESVIDLLKMYYEKYGYFMHYNFGSYKENCEIYSIVSMAFALLYICRSLKDDGSFTAASLSHGSEERYLSYDGYTGLLPRLCKLKFYDLFTRIIEEIIVPMCEHYGDKDYKLFAENELYYKEPADVKYFTLKNKIRRYADKTGITLPESFLKFC